MSSSIWKEFATKILNTINFKAEYEALGLNIVKKTGDSYQARCPFHEDTEPSFSFFEESGHWKCFAQCGHGSFSDFAMRVLNKEYKEVILYYAAKFGIETPKPSLPPINPNIAEKYHQALMDARDKLEWLITGKRGFTRETIERFQIGWNGKRYSFPVRDEHKELVNIRLYDPAATESNKMTSYTAGSHRYGEARLYGLDTMADLPETTPVIICEGEADRLVLEQCGFAAITGTAGAGTFKEAWKSHFRDRNVYICFDNDEPGRKGAKSVAIALYGSAASIRIITLPDTVGDKGDITDYFIKLGYTADHFRELMDTATPYEPKPQTGPAEDIIRLANFADIENKAYIDQRVEVALTVCGETSDSFHAPTEFELTYCKKRVTGKCHLCADGNPELKFTLNPGDTEFIGSCMATDDQVMGMLRKRICQFGEHPQLKITQKTTIKEFFAHQHQKRYVNYIAEFSQDASSESADVMEHKVYYVLDDYEHKIRTVKPKSYLARGYVKSHPKTQHVSFLIDHLEEVEDEHEKFSVAQSIEHLRSIHGEKEPRTGVLDTDLAIFMPRIMAVINDVSDNVIKVYRRSDVVFAMLMVFCSVLKIPFNKEFIRGWLNLVVVGDSGTAKSLIYNRIATYIGVGDITSATSSSRTGIVYGLSEHQQKGWQVKAGRLPANSQKILCVDEIQKMERDDLAALQNAIDDGWISIDRISSKGFETMTRFIALCNPKRDDTTLDNYSFGCQVLKGIFPVAFIRRLDLAMFTSQDDIPKFEDINTLNTSDEPRITSEQLRALVFWAWTRRPGDIVIDSDVTSLILSKASSMSKVYGYCTDIPLIAPSDFRKNLTRMSVACAILDTSTDLTFEKVIVRPEHVEFICMWLDSVYQHDNCGLDQYSDISKMGHVLEDADYEHFKDDAKALMAQDHGTLTMRFLVAFIRNTDCITREDISEQLGCSSESIRPRISLLKKYGLIKSGKSGYKNTSKFNKILRKLKEDFKEEWDSLSGRSVYAEGEY